jgi:hypothetical protein
MVGAYYAPKPVAPHHHKHHYEEHSRILPGKSAETEIPLTVSPQQESKPGALFDILRRLAFVMVSTGCQTSHGTIRRQTRLESFPTDEG